ncbi:O-antigen ligase family protein [Roseobacter sp. MH60115]|uniref:O-antigen ligase family protein n=1 Tax=Roseobacter sp. MH60115 TaxID=2785324 RepID=UPI0018A25B3A|nr:O-antigen ligase family protein [Roseobacter sp. MH60115]
MTVYTRQDAPIFRTGARPKLPPVKRSHRQAERPKQVAEPVKTEAVQALPADAVAQAAPAAKGNRLFILFIFSLLFPIVIKLGPIVLFPYRIFLLVMFIPLFIRLVSGKAGGILTVDWFMMLATFWAGVALAANHPFGRIIEPFGVYTLEFFGAYLVGRIGIRSAKDFIYMVKLAFLCIALLLPFAFIEAVTNKNILLDLLPSSIRDTDQGVRMGFHRAQTIFAHSIHYGVFASLLLGLTWYAFSPGKPLLRFILTFPVVAFSTFLSLATGALIAFNVQFLLILWEVIMKPIRQRWVIFGWLSVAGYIFVDIMATKSPFHTLVAKLAFSQTSAYNRILIFDHGMKNVMANPWTGLGMNDWVRPSFMSSSTDNFWLLIAMRYGIPGFAFFAIAIFLIMRRGARVPLTDPLDRACRAGFLTAMGGLIISGGTVDYWKGMLAFMLFFIGSGVWLFSGGANTTPPAPEEPDADTLRRQS